jgi:alkanesulfonate monooxygenase SsuD/methylene tetrahydromethanopterin reductase-like flavin-dependent oxidoreductase (luciferase family)
MAFVGETEADVRKQLPTVRFNHEMLLHLHNGTAVVTDGHVTNPPLLDPLTGEKLVEGDRFGWKGATAAYSDEDTYENLIVGTPDRVRGIVKQYHDLGLDQLMLYMAFGAPQDEVLRSLRLFAQEVMPHFRGEPAAVGARA